MAVRTKLPIGQILPGEDYVLPGALLRNILERLEKVENIRGSGTTVVKDTGYGYRVHSIPGKNTDPIVFVRITGTHPDATDGDGIYTGLILNRKIGIPVDPSDITTFSMGLGGTDVCTVYYPPGVGTTIPLTDVLLPSGYGLPGRIVGKDVDDLPVVELFPFPPPRGTFTVILQTDGGDGSVGDPYTYTVTDELTNETLTTGESPIYDPPFTTLTPATLGLGDYDPDGNFRLLQAYTSSYDTGDCVSA
jgi:hypothetical protein